MDKYISKYQAAADNFDGAAENIERIMVRLGDDQRNEGRQGERGSSDGKETRQAHFTTSLRSDGRGGSRQPETGVPE